MAQCSVLTFYVNGEAVELTWEYLKNHGGFISVTITASLIDYTLLDGINKFAIDFTDQIF